MSRRHFTALAKAMLASKPHPSSDPLTLVQWRRDVSAVARVCASFNPAFDGELFLAACGVT